MAKGFGRAKKRREKLEASMDRLTDLNIMIPWAMFVEILDQLAPKERKSNAGRKPLDRLRLFKMLILVGVFSFSPWLNPLSGYVWHDLVERPRRIRSDNSAHWERLPLHLIFVEIPQISALAD